MSTYRRRTSSPSLVATSAAKSLARDLDGVRHARTHSTYGQHEPRPGVWVLRAGVLARSWRNRMEPNNDARTHCYCDDINIVQYLLYGTALRANNVFSSVSLSHSGRKKEYRRNSNSDVTTIIDRRRYAVGVITIYYSADDAQLIIIQ